MIWAYVAAYFAAGAIFYGWVAVALDNEELNRAWPLLVLLWPMLVLITIGAWLGSRS